MTVIKGAFATLKVGGVVVLLGLIIAQAYCALEAFGR